jgi:hypothetical protein
MTESMKLNNMVTAGIAREIEGMAGGLAHGRARGKVFPS